ncbi:MAG: hypothetical protein MO846_11155 [Candidatus Devosia symbiotica]|nr:hypothetical protein [Candidatus Devosia symbiotica]
MLHIAHRAGVDRHALRCDDLQAVIEQRMPGVHNESVAGDLLDPIYGMAET